MTELKYSLNNFGGAVIDSLDLPDNPEIFTVKLEKTIDILKNRNIKVIWMSLPIEKSILVDYAVKSGFIYHHASEKYLELTLRLIEESYIPPYATHYTGAGGVVIDENENLLVIVEKYSNVKKHYKLPGGTIMQGEHISDAVCREVYEETGIRTEFKYLSAFRHWHGYRFDKSDIYFVCRLKPLNLNIVIDENEIIEAKWMPVKEFIESDETRPFNRKIVKSALSGKGFRIETVEGYGSSDTHEMFFQV